MTNKAINHLKKDRKLAKIIKTVGPHKISVVRDPYESLVEAIITQQLSGKAADSISKRFRGIYRKFPKPKDVLRTPDSKLRAAGLSSMKVSYIKDLSRKIESNEIKMSSLRNMTDDEVVEHLTQVRGIGRWTAEMFLIFSLGRLDVLPVGDLGLRKGVQRLYSLSDIPEKEKIESIAEKWRPYRTVATWYIWKSLSQFDNIG
jgi:DNA-3-methyladenine glycosylase II